MKAKFFIPILSIFLVIAIACEKTDKTLDAIKDGKATVGDTVRIYQNDTVVFPSSNFSLYLSKVEDSRCPIGVECVWEGNARAELSYNDAQCALEFDLNTVFIRAKIVKNVLISLVDVKPYPDIHETLPVENTNVILVVSNVPDSLLKGTVKDYTGMDGCGYVIELDNGSKLEPVKVDNTFTFADKQRVALSYKELKDLASICMVGKMAEITSIYEIVE